ncbi:hypothetical protein F5876DRAFT_72344 [Lentinula aff. lateritia]|uniref:Uncharacterized protein n=1 Tax=Lentinula aff. lateritia TaxID=2804960 RepID=A0ACC1UEV0_9AGAR|nr:hypothetical protein F5876DRAFT_72344 [Lentinula aff. lateritia]
MIIKTDKALQDGSRTLRNFLKHSGHSEEIDSPPDYEEIEGADSLPESTPISNTATSSTATKPVSGPPVSLARPHSARAVTNNASKNSPANNISISHPFGSINCAYTVDPTLTLFPSSSRGTRIQSNVKLRTNVGSIDADLTLMHGAKEDNSTLPRATMDISSKMGTVNVTLRRPSSVLPTIRLFASSRAGSLSVRVPTNFHGFITAYTKIGRLTLEPSLQSSAVVLREEIKVKRVFIGDPNVLRGSVEAGSVQTRTGQSTRDPESDSEGESDSDSEEYGRETKNGGWEGDRIVLRTPVGNIELGYIEERHAYTSQYDIMTEFRAAYGRGRGHRGRGGRGGRGGRSIRGIIEGGRGTNQGVFFPPAPSSSSAGFIL